MAEGGAGGKEVGRISIRVVPNTDRFRQDLQRQLDAIEHDLKVKIRVDPDMGRFREEVNAGTRGLKDAKVKVKAELDRKGDLIHDLDAAVEHKSIKVKVKPEIDESAFARMRARIAGSKMFSGLLANVGNSGASFGSGFSHVGAGLTPNIAGFGGVASIAIILGALSLLAPALALVAQALVGLPALVSAVALPIGVLALGFGGIKKALTDSGILTDTKGKKGAKDKLGLGSFLKEVQNDVSNVFEKGLTPLFRQMFDAFSGAIPVLTRGLPFVAQGLVNLATGLTRAVTSVPNLQLMDRMTNSVGTMLTNLTPGLTSFTNGMIALITNVGDHLPGLGTVMSGWADRFSSWVSKVSKPQDFWGKNVGPSTLDSAVTNLKPILNSIINFVGQLTDAGLKLAANPQMADNIKKVVDGLTNMVTSLLPQLNTVFDKLAGIMGKIQPDQGKPDPSKPKAPPGAKFTGLPPGEAPEPKKDDFVPKSGLGLIEKWFRDSKWSPWRPNTGHSVVVEGNVGAKPPQSPPMPVGAVDGGAGAVGGSKGWFGGTGQQQIQAPKIEAPKLPPGSEKIWDKLVEATKAAGAQIMAEVSSWAGKITGALQAAAAGAQAAGVAVGTGMAAGIAAGAPSAIAAARALAQGVESAAKTHLGIKSPSRVFHGIGQDTTQGFQNGLQEGTQGVVDAANGLAQQVTDAVKNGTAGISGKQLSGDIKQELQAIQVQQDQLRAQSDGTSDKGQKKAIKGQMDQLDLAKDQLKASSTQLGYSEKFGNSQANSTEQQRAQLDMQQDQLKAQYDATSDPVKKRGLKEQMDQIKAQKDLLKMQDDQHSKSKQSTDQTKQMLSSVGQAVSGVIGIGQNFAMANVNQFEQDLGMSGKGAIPTIANIGLNWASGMLSKTVSGAISGAMGGQGQGQGDTHIHVNSIDEGLAAKQTLENRKAMQYSGR